MSEHEPLKLINGDVWEHPNSCELVLIQNINANQYMLLGISQNLHTSLAVVLYPYYTEKGVALSADDAHHWLTSNGFMLTSQLLPWPQPMQKHDI